MHSFRCEQKKEKNFFYGKCHATTMRNVTINQSYRYSISSLKKEEWKQNRKSRRKYRKCFECHQFFDRFKEWEFFYFFLSTFFVVSTSLFLTQSCFVINKMNLYNKRKEKRENRSISRKYSAYMYHHLFIFESIAITLKAFILKNLLLWIFYASWIMPFSVFGTILCHFCFLFCMEFCVWMSECYSADMLKLNEIHFIDGWIFYRANLMFICHRLPKERHMVIYDKITVFTFSFFSVFFALFIPLFHSVFTLVNQNILLSTDSQWVWNECTQKMSFKCAFSIWKRKFFRPPFDHK